MKILFDSYSTVTQNPFGGVSVRMKKTLNKLLSDVEVKLFDKWEDKIADYDILHIFKVSIDTFSEILHAKRVGCKVVVSSVVDPKSNFKLLVNKLFAVVFRQSNSFALIKKSFDLADAIMCQTVFEKAFLEKFFSIEASKIYVIPSAIDAAKQETTEEYFRNKTGIEGKFILNVGRFDSNKNQMSLIKAVKGTDMQLVLIGGADKDSPDYFDKCKKEASENVHFLGWVEHNDPLLSSAYVAAHTFVLPSHHEIFGNTLFEAGVYGCNVVATNALPLDSWGFGDKCLSVKPDSIEDIKEKLQKSYNMERSGEVAEIIKKDFSWESVIEKYLEVYKRVLKER